MKILYVSTISMTIHAFLIPHIEMLIEQGHKVDIACNMVTAADDRLIKLGCRYLNLDFQRAPLDKRNISAYKKLKRLIKDEQYDLVHTHTPVASFCVRLACMRQSAVKVFYTAHGFHFFKGAPMKNWLFYYPIERFLSRYTDELITINKEDYARAKKSLKAKSASYVPGVGIEMSNVTKNTNDEKTKKSELGIAEEDIVIVSVGELNGNKNHSTVIRAVAEMKLSDATYVICGEGELKAELLGLIDEYGLKDKVKLLGRRTDVFAILKIADIFVHPSFREGLPVALMEAMAAGLPCVVSNTRGNIDLIEDGAGGYVREPDDINGFASAICQIITDRQLADIMGRHNEEAVRAFDLSVVLLELSKIYENYV